MKLIAFVLFSFLIGTLVGAIPRGPSEVSPEDELEQWEKRDVLADFANEIKEESGSLSLLSKRSIPWEAVNNISNIIEPLRDQLRNVTFDELIQVLENLITNSTNNTSPEIRQIIRGILDLPLLGNIINASVAVAGLSADIVAVAFAIIIRVIVILPQSPIPIPPIPILPNLIPPNPIPPNPIPPNPIPQIPVPRIPIPRPLQPFLRPFTIPPFI
ncbi:arp2/3 complex-activating protein rickA-like [Frieseomelitta varia]|uniref:arp2/3 complex-activating protein rickA-like n=1 Tax=Frieseomelitta varia TaxID=561572 RepID=UPI001CB67E02|nr:arp2/3 complex-activating protein rickA-like [Frieseomelitta varia]